MNLFEKRAFPPRGLNIYVKIKLIAVHILDYDEFNIYTTIEDVENYLEKIISEGIQAKDEAYEKCLEKFGGEFKGLIDLLFQEEQ